MDFKKSMLILITAIFLISIAGVCASDVNDTIIAGDDADQIEVSSSDVISEDNMQTGEENAISAQADDESASAESDSQTLSEGEGNYTDLRRDIENGGSLTKSYYRYHSGEGESIEITTPNSLINGNGAVIDMESNYGPAFKVTASNVTFKNLTIKGAIYVGYGGAAIHFGQAGSVINCSFCDNSAYNGGAVYFVDGGSVIGCSFTNNDATNCGGAVYFQQEGYAINCSFADNRASGEGGAVYFEYGGSVINCSFTGNWAVDNMDSGGAIYFSDSGNVTNCSFVNNKAAYTGGAVYCIRACNVVGCTFIANNATSGNGGAVYCMGACNVADCSFIANRAISGFGGAVRFGEKANMTNCNFTGNFAGESGGAVYCAGECNATGCSFIANNASSDGGAVHFESQATLSDCDFTGNSAETMGGAAYFSESAVVQNCNFTANNAINGGAIHTSTMGYGKLTGCDFAKNSAFNGGAVNMYAGMIDNCEFKDNHAENAGGAVVFSEGGDIKYCGFEGNTASSGGAVDMFSGNIEKCSFIGNNATRGSAIFLHGFSGTNISNSCLLNNRANVSDNEPLNVAVNLNTFEVTFKGQNNLLNAIYSNGDVNFTNVVYWGVGGIENTGSDCVVLSPFECEEGQNITFTGLVNGNLLKATFVTDIDGKVVLNNVLEYYLVIRHDRDSYYTEAGKTVSDMTYYVNVTSQTTSGRTANITAKSNIYAEFMPGSVIFILPDTNITANYSSNGIWWATYEFGDYADYEVNVSCIGLDNVALSNATITVSKIRTELIADAVTATYNVNRNLVVTLMGSDGNPLSGVKVSVSLNGVREYVTDKNGRIKVSTKGLAVKTYTAKITFSGNGDCLSSSKEVKVTVKKAKPKLIAKKKTFKKSKKARKYAVTLKDNVGKAMKKVKMTLNVKGKTYKATTNSKGKATFNLKKLSKKGKYKATVTYKGDKFYNKVTKKVKITVK